MRITHEVDYAIRIVYCLAVHNSKVSAKDIAEETGVPLRFALKILRKLIQCEMVRSFKGVNGGYQLAVSPDDLSLGHIVEAIDGEITINHCLSGEFNCTRVEHKYDCDFHRIFASVNAMIRKELYKFTFGSIIANHCECGSPNKLCNQIFQEENKNG